MSESVEVVRASRLRAGDRLLGSQRTVEWARVNPWNRRRTIVKLSGEDHTREWGSSTTIQIARTL